MFNKKKTLLNCDGVKTQGPFLMYFSGSLPCWSPDIPRQAHVAVWTTENCVQTSQV